MSLAHKVKAVERLYSRLDAEIASFVSATGLGCVAACGRCCTKPDIEATILEFLPFAYHAHKAGVAVDIWEQLKIQNTENPDQLCTLFSPILVGDGRGFCSDYAYRGMICRLFGYSTRTTKDGTRAHLACNTMKTEKPDELIRVNELIQSGGHAPNTSDYGYALIGIDRELGTLRFPINMAIQKALEYVLSYYSYRRKRA